MRRRLDRDIITLESAAPKAKEEIAQLVDELAHALGERARFPLHEGSAPSQAARTPVAGTTLEPAFLEADPDESEMPIPSTWRTPAWPEEPAASWSRWLSVPLVLVLAAAVAAVFLLATTGGVPRIADPGTLGALAPAPATIDGKARERAFELMAESQHLIAAGNIIAARRLLSAAAENGDAAARLKLAETFDPNMLAAWGTYGQAPDVAAAKEHYAKALAGGMGDARQRLEALEGPR